MVDLPALRGPAAVAAAKYESVVPDAAVAVVMLELQDVTLDLLCCSAVLPWLC
jgi:hypothetical protein